MNGRTLTVLTTLAGVLAVGEFGSSIMIWKENYPGSLPLAAVVFGVWPSFGPGTPAPAVRAREP